MKGKSAKAAALIFLFASSAKAKADALALAVAGGYVSQGTVRVYGKAERFRFQGPAGEASAYFKYQDYYLGIGLEEEHLANAYTQDGAAETLTSRDYSILGAVQSPKFPVVLDAGLGATRMTFKQIYPASHGETYVGWHAKAGLQMAFRGDRDANLFLRVEGIYRSLLSGKDSVDRNAKLLPLNETCVPVFLGGLIRF